MSFSPFKQLDEQPYLSSWSQRHETTPDQELIDYNALESLHNISSMMIKNNPIAQALQIAQVSTILGGEVHTNLVGPTSMETKGQDILDDAFSGLDINQQFTYSSLREQIVTGAFDRGDLLMSLASDKNRGDTETYLELIDTARLSTPNEFKSNPLSRNGVQYDKRGLIQGYWVKKLDDMAHCYSGDKKTYTFYPRYKKDSRTGYSRLVTDLFLAPTNLKPNQSRQIPLLTQSMKPIRLLDQYIEAVVIGARVAACHAGFISTSNPAGAKRSAKGGMDNLGKINPGTMYFLKRGDRVDFSSPSRPADNADVLIKRLIIHACASIRIPYDIAFLDLQDTNYSSWKGGSLEAGRNAKRWVQLLQKVDTWVSNTILLEAISKRRLKGSLKNTSIVSRYPRYNPLDDEKSARADNLNLNKNKTTSQHQVCEENNQDWQQVQDERLVEAMSEVKLQAEVLKEQKVYEKKYGILFSEPKDDKSSGDGDKRDTSKSRRPGEEKGGDLDDEDAKDRRKDDGNN